MSDQTRTRRHVRCPECGERLDVLLELSCRFALERRADGTYAIGPLADTRSHLRRLAARDHGDGYQLSLEDTTADDGADGPVAICRGPDRHVMHVDELTTYTTRERHT